MKNVEVVKLVVKDTIEDYILDMQIRKTAEIDKTTGEAALSNRHVPPLFPLLSVYPCSLLSSSHLIIVFFSV